jgi:hypothetical protein
MLETSPDYPRACTLRASATSVPGVRFMTSLRTRIRSMRTSCSLGKIKDVAGESSSSVLRCACELV